MSHCLLNTLLYSSCLLIKYPTPPKKIDKRIPPVTTPCKTLMKSPGCKSETLPITLKKTALVLVTPLSENPPALLHDS